MQIGTVPVPINAKVGEIAKIRRILRMVTILASQRKGNRKSWRLAPVPSKNVLDSQTVLWIRIRIDFDQLDPDPDPVGQK